MKKWLKPVIIFVVILVALSLGKDMIVKASAESACRIATGLELKIQSLHLDLFRSYIDIKKLKLFNPSSFPEKTMANVPEIFVNIEVGSLFGGKEVHVEEMRLNVSEIVIVKNKDGKTNLDYLNPGGGKKKEAKDDKAPAKAKGKTPKIRIDQLKLKVTKVVYKDYTGGGAPKVQEFNVNLDESYSNITNVNVIVPIIVSRAIMNTAVSSLVKIDMKGMLSNVDLSGLDLQSLDLGRFSGLAKEMGANTTETLAKVTEGMDDKAGEAVKEIKNLFGSIGK